jgi:hypothetical protein
MANKRREHDRACRCDQADAGCAALAVQRLSRSRVQELAEEIWTVTNGTAVPERPLPDPRGSRPGASAQAAYRRRRHKELGQWRDGWRSRWAWLVAAAVLGVGLLVTPVLRPPGRRLVQGIPLVARRRLPDRLRRGPRVEPSQVQRASARALEVLRPAA